MKRTKLDFLGKEFSRKWAIITANIIVVFTLLGGGYSAGNYLSEISCERKMLELTEDYQEKILAPI